MHRLRLMQVVSVLALVVMACQPAVAPAQPSSSNTPAAKQASSADTSAAKQASSAPTPAPKQASSAAPTRVTIGVTDPLESRDPLGHSNTFMYPMWCDILGCLAGWDPKTGDPIPQLAESWESPDPTTWIFHLRKGVTFSDGTPFTAADVLATLERVKSHPQAMQKNRLTSMKSWEAVDDHTVKITTKEPDAELLDAAFVVGIGMESKAQLDRGDDLAKVNAVGTGPYKLKEWVSGQRVVLEKNPSWWGGKVEGPDEVIYTYIKEDAARVTALLNNEIQIASYIPPQDVERINAQSNVQVIPSDSLTNMFLGMNPNFKPWDNKLLRQAVAYAIDRDTIIKSLLQGYADRLDGPIGPGQYAYDPNLQPKYPYNPEKAKELVKQAGFPDGVDVELQSPIGRYLMDKEIIAAIGPMLTAVGIRTKVSPLEYSTIWANIQAGKVPFYYFGRGSLRDPGQALSQYFGTGVTKRIGYSNPTLDALLQKERAAFDPDARKQALREAMSFVTDEAPAHFLWRYKMLWGVSKSLQWTPRADEGIVPSEIRVK